jgi:hypothetical protein
MTPAFSHFWMDPQDPLIRDPVLQEPPQPAPIELGEEVADVHVEHPVHLLRLDPDRQRIQCTMRAAPWPEPVREAEEVLLIDAVQHLDEGALGDLVLQASDTERPLPPVRLGDHHPPHRLRPVRSAVQPPVEVLKVRLQVLPVSLPRHPVHPRRRLRVDGPVGFAQAVDVHVVCHRSPKTSQPRSGENQPLGGHDHSLFYPSPRLWECGRAEGPSKSGGQAGRIAVGEPESGTKTWAAICPGCPRDGISTAFRGRPRSGAPVSRLPNGCAGRLRPPAHGWTGTAGAAGGLACRCWRWCMR